MKPRIDVDALFVVQPWQLLLAMIADAMPQEQQRTIEYLRTENQILKEKLRKRRILLTDDRRPRLAVKGHWVVARTVDMFRTLGRRASTRAHISRTPLAYNACQHLIAHLPHLGAT